MKSKEMGRYVMRTLVGLNYKVVHLKTRTMKLVSAAWTLYDFLLCKPPSMTRIMMVSHREKMGQDIMLFTIQFCDSKCSNFLNQIVSANATGTAIKTDTVRSSRLFDIFSLMKKCKKLF